MSRQPLNESVEHRRAPRRHRSSARATLALVATVALALGALVAPGTNASAAQACASAWGGSSVYVAGDVVSADGTNFRAKWWTQGETPAQHTGQGQVWEDQGACGGSEPGDPDDPGDPGSPGDPGDPPKLGNAAAAPYIYPGWGDPPSPSMLMKETGIGAFTIAFVLADGCNPVWDGEGGLTGGVHEQTIREIQDAGGTVIPSFGGWSGNKLGPNCPNAEALAGAYQKVIDTFGLTAIDIDIENSDEFENEAVADRIVSALKIVEERNPGITTIVTFATSTTGPTYYGKRLISRAKELGAPIDVFTQMPFDFGGGDMFDATVGASEGLNAELRTVYGWSEAEAYSHMGISGMNGLSDQREVTSPETWQRITDWASGKGLARFTFWAVNRDRGCADGGVVSTCSGIAQDDWEFTRITAGF